MIGRTVSHYEILDKLGSGGMGVVYRARDVKLDRTVALKFLSTELSMSEQERKRFASEAKAFSALDHPNIGVVFDIDETSDGQTFIVMAYYPGQTMKQKIAARPPLDQAIGFVIQIAQGLAKAHSHGIIHRDIKPSNIMVTADGVPKIIDFGLALASGATLTITASTKGTPVYMSPEQALGEDVDARTDLWALGVMLYEMVTGKLPFPGDSAPAILFEVVHHEPVRPRDICAGTDPELERIVLKAIAKKREDRYSSAAEMVRDLSAFQNSLSAPFTPAAGPIAWRKPLAIAAGLAVVLAAGAFFRIASWRRERQEAAADVARLIRDGQFPAAFARAKAAGSAIAENQWDAMSSTVAIETTPPGADIRWKNYATPEVAWQPLGRSPLAKVRIPLGVLRVEVSKDGFETLERVLVKWNGDLHDAEVEPQMGVHGDRIRFDLSRLGAFPAGMVTVPAGPFAIASSGFRLIRWTPTSSTSSKSLTGSTRNSSTKVVIETASTGKNAWCKVDGS